jgi:hypothetical protein
MREIREINPIGNQSLDHTGVEDRKARKDDDQFDVYPGIHKLLG